MKVNWHCFKRGLHLLTQYAIFKHYVKKGGQMDKETVVAFKIALAIAIVVGFGLYQFNLKYKIESDLTDRAIIGSRHIPLRGWTHFTFTKAFYDSLTSMPADSLSVYLQTEKATCETVYTTSEWEVDTSKIRESVLSSKLKFKGGYGGRCSK